MYFSKTLRNICFLQVTLSKHILLIYFFEIEDIYKSLECIYILTVSQTSAWEYKKIKYKYKIT